MRRLPGWACGVGARWCALACALVLASCSGGRDEDLSCTDVSLCRPGSSCVDGFCMETDNLRVSASASSAGATVPVLVIDAAGKSCEASQCKDLPYGSMVTFRASETPGFRFTGWTASAECTGTKLELQVATLTSDTSCVANYIRRLKVAGTALGVEGGVSASSGSGFAVCSGGVCEVDIGASVKLTAEPRFGERFQGWSGDGCGDGKMLETIVTATDKDLLCIANFVPRLAVSAQAMNAETSIEVSSPGGVCEPGSCVLDKGASATLRAPAVAGFRFAGWSGTPSCLGNDSVLTLAAVSEAQLCLATYLPRVTVSGSASGATPPPAVTALSSDLYASCVGASCETDVNGSVTLLASSASGYRLLGWSGEMCVAETGAAIELKEVTSSLACVANYVQGIAVIGAVVGAPGEVTASSSTPLAQCAAGGCVIDVGGNASLAAPVIEGYRFLGWDGDPGCASANTTIAFEAVTQSLTCYARFATRFLVRGSAAPAEGGSVRPSSASPGAVCTAESCTLDGGGEVALEAVPSAGYRFSGWSGGACTGAEPIARVTNVAGNVTCQANFIGRLTVSAAASPGTGGSVLARSDSAAAACMGASCQLDQGSRVVLSATPAPGFRFTSWSQCSDSSEPSLTLEGVRRDTLCQANFVPLRFTVSSTVAPPDTGSVLASAIAGEPACSAGGCTVNYGSDVSLVAQPAVGHRFLGWTGCQTSTAATLLVANVRADVACQANFERIVLRVGVTAGAGGSVMAGSGSPGASCSASGCSVPYGGQVMAAATAQAGYRFDAWSGCSTSSEAALTLSNVTADAACTASFVRLRFTVSGSPAPAEGGTVAASSGAAGATCNGASCSVDFGGTVALAASASRGFRFTGWTGCRESAAPTLTITNVTAEVRCQASFERLRYTVSGTASPATLGSVVASSTSPGAACVGAGCEVSFGSSVTLTPAPATGSRFVGWSDCPVSGAGPIVIATVEGAVACQANFERLSFVVNGVAGPGGSIIGAVGQTACPNASCTVVYDGSASFLAMPAAGFAVAEWSGCAVGSDPLFASVSNVRAPATCTLSFARIIFPVTGQASGGGSISGESGGAPCPGNVCQVPSGGSATFTAGADTAALRFTGFSGCAASAQNPRVAVVANVRGPVTCSANFAVPVYTVVGSASNGGTITASSNGVSCAGPTCSVPYGGNASFTVGPDPTGFVFSNFTGACVQSGARTARIDPVVGDAMCIANFTRAQLSVTGRAAGGSIVGENGAVGGAVCVDNVCSVPYQGGASFIAAPLDASWELAGWTGCTEDPQNRLRATISNVVANATCSVAFRQVSYTLRGEASGRGTVSASAGGAPCANNACTVTRGSVVTMTATPDANAGARFNGWSGCSASRELTINVPATASETCTASFALTVTVETAVGQPGRGRATLQSAAPATCAAGGAVSCTLDPGTTATLTATPSSGEYVFRGWTGCVSADPSSAITTIAPVNAATCTANFALANPTVTTTTNAPDGGFGTVDNPAPGGTCAGATSCTIVGGGSAGGSVLLFVASTGAYSFTGWSGRDCSPTPPPPGALNPYTLSGVTENTECTANFQPIILE